MAIFLGLDVGTQGARAIVCDENGHVLAQASEQFAELSTAGLPKGWAEQDPETWWTAAGKCLKRVTASIDERVTAVAVDSTSGTILPVDSLGNPLSNALMYNDSRATDEARICNEAGKGLTEKLGYKFGASFALPKILWIKNNKPAVYSKTFRFLHAADFIVGRLTGNFSASDYSNALKTGYDLADLTWPGFIENKLGIPIAMLPEVVTPGEIIGSVSEKAAEQTGIPTGTPVAAGISDGTAGFIASGAAKVGDWNSTIGTTLVLRGVSKELVSDPVGRIYCHRHPDGWWLPGGASNVGGKCLADLFPDADYAAMDRESTHYLPTDLIVYPLTGRGERLPFVDPATEGFLFREPKDRTELYAAYLQGVAFVERWCLELMSELGADTSGEIYTTGGGAKSLVWMQVRADVLGKRIIRPAVTESAIGSAITAASRTHYSSLSEAIENMVTRDVVVEPDASKTHAYEERYRAFREECGRKGMGVGG